MDSLTLAMSNSTNIDTKDKLLVALLKYLLNLLDTDNPEDENEHYQKNYGPKIVPFRTMATNG